MGSLAIQCQTDALIVSSRPIFVPLETDGKAVKRPNLTEQVGGGEEEFRKGDKRALEQSQQESNIWRPHRLISLVFYQPLVWISRLVRIAKL